MAEKTFRPGWVVRSSVIATLAVMLGGYVCAQAAGMAEAQSQADAPPRVPFAVPAGVTVTRDIVYTGSGSSPQALDLFLPAKGDGPFPGVVFIHGGAWSAGSKNDFQRQAAYLAERGFVCISINYRLSQQAHFPAALYDAKAAVRWMRAHAREYRIDPERIAAAGGSAGGQLAALLGTTADVKTMEGESGNPRFSSRVQAVVAFNPLTDFVSARIKTQSPTAVTKAVEAFLGGSLDEIPEVYVAASPVAHVSAATPPFLFLHGTADTTLPYSQSIEMQNALHAVGVRAELFTAEGANHGFFNRAPFYQPSVERMYAFLESVLNKKQATAASCESLKTLALSDTTVASAQVVDPGAFRPPEPAGETSAQEQVKELQTFGQLPAFCRVAATIKPAPDSNIRIEVWMPIAGWNRRFLGVGNGGWGGTINYGSMAGALRQGFAVGSSDMGTGGFVATHRSTWTMLESDDRLRDFGFRATHLMTVEAKAILREFYAEPPRFSYWNGCSTGGKQGLAEAQRYPEDYNGIVEGDPASYFTHLMFSLQWYGVSAKRDPAGAIPQDKFALLHRAVLRACDSLDGVEDGIIGDPQQCHFDPRSLACKSGDGTGCLSAAQIKTVEALYRGAANPRTGEQIFPGQAAGSELGWAGLLHVPGPTLTSLSYFQFALHRDPNWDATSLNFDEDVAAADAADGVILNDIDPDLRSFKAHGGKLIMFHGWSDPIISPGESIQYFDRVSQAVGGPKKTQDFVRLFMLPGVGHCHGGPGADDFDKIGAIERWTEQGSPPDALTATHHGDGNGPDITRPLCSYPETAHWNGSGNSGDASSFSCR